CARVYYGNLYYFDYW
nr:immunoglobulin heavy chain junction region [Mus musculus]MBK4195777.1 immunoglobulin heavy chain junction region [Mus musculus]